MGQLRPGHVLRRSGLYGQEADGITDITDLDGATVCVTSGTTTELNLADAFRQRGLDFTPVTYEDLPSVYGAYEEGRCDAATSDKSQWQAPAVALQTPLHISSWM
jgi:general L-amino acid transport system substrate-binding protein